MFTNNYIAFRHNMFFGLASSSNSWPGDFKGKDMISAGGNKVQMYSGGSHLNFDIGRNVQWISCDAIITASGSSATAGLRIGSGSTPATREDYTLENQITSGISFSNTTSNLLLSDEGNGKYSLSVAFVMTNTSEENITISEIGLFSSIPTSGSTKASVLMERTVLTAPIVVPPGEMKSLNYKITFNQPS